MMLFFLFICGTATADFYTWQDKNGNTQITDYPPPQDKSAKDVQVHQYKSDNLSGLQNEEEKKSVSEDDKLKSAKPPEVVLYTKNDCIDCDKARNFLKSKNIPFTEYNMDNDKTSFTRRKEIDDSEEVPFAIINKDQVYGFSETIYNKVLKPIAEPNK